MVEEEGGAAFRWKRLCEQRCHLPISRNTVSEERGLGCPAAASVAPLAILPALLLEREWFSKVPFSLLLQHSSLAFWLDISKEETRKQINLLFFFNTYHHIIIWICKSSLKKTRKSTAAAAAAAAKSLHSCPTLWNPVDSSPPGSAVPGIFQARTLEWVAISFSSAWKWKVRARMAKQREYFLWHCVVKP